MPSEEQYSGGASTVPSMREPQLKSRMTAVLRGGRVLRLRRLRRRTTTRSVARVLLACSGGGAAGSGVTLPENLWKILVKILHFGSF